MFSFRGSPFISISGRTTSERFRFCGDCRSQRNVAIFVTSHIGQIYFLLQLRRGKNIKATSEKGTEYLLKAFSKLKNGKAVNPQSREYLRFASEIDRTLGVSHWKEVCALTLTLKQVIFARDGRKEALDQIKCYRNFQCFMGRLNRAIYGNAVRRHGTRLRVISAIEKDADGRFHIHAAIERPQRISEPEFKALIEDCWSQTRWGNHRTKIVFDADQGWVDYLLKPKQKSGLEAWIDCLDWNSFHNPIADA